MIAMAFRKILLLQRGDGIRGGSGRKAGRYSGPCAVQGKPEVLRASVFPHHSQCCFQTWASVYSKSCHDPPFQSPPLHPSGPLNYRPHSPPGPLLLPLSLPVLSGWRRRTRKGGGQEQDGEKELDLGLSTLSSLPMDRLKENKILDVKFNFWLEHLLWRVASALC